MAELERRLFHWVSDDPVTIYRQAWTTLMLRGLEDQQITTEISEFLDELRPIIEADGAPWEKFLSTLPGFREMRERYLEETRRGGSA